MTSRRDARPAAALVVSFVASLAPLLVLTTSCGPAAELRGGENLLLVTLCGARADLLEQSIAAGELPTLASLRDRAAVRTEIDSTAPLCGWAADELLTVVPAISLGFCATGRVGLEEACAKDGYATAAFVSRSELLGCRGWFQTFDAPPIERLSFEMFGPKAAPLELCRDTGATAEAALAWLSHATTPFFAWVELDALAIEKAQAPGELRDVAKRRLAAIDAAVAKLLDELERGGRAARTWIAFTSDHGEALGEEDFFGHRRLLPCVTRVPLWIVAPSSRAGATVAPPSSMHEVGRLLAQALGLSTHRDPTVEPTHAADAASIEKRRRKDSDQERPLDFLIEQGRVPLADDAARAVLPRLRELVAATSEEDATEEGINVQLRAAELYLGALHALESPSAEEQDEKKAARARWLEEVVFGLPNRPFAATLYARPEPGSDAPADRRWKAAREARAAAPWYFPAVRALASLEQMALRPNDAIAALEQFASDAPLTPSARAEFERLLAATRRNVVPTLPKPPR